MNFICDKQILLKEISYANEIISVKNNLSILSNILCILENDTLKIKATDLKIHFDSVLLVKTITPGKVSIFCSKLVDILRSCPEGDIEIIAEEDFLYIKPIFKKIQFKIKTIPAEKYPEIIFDDDCTNLTIAQNDFIQMITQTNFAISLEETRVFMNGVLFEKGENKLMMVATDGRRLSYCEKFYNTENTAFLPIIIPPKILSLIKKYASSEGVLEIGISLKNIFVKINNIKISSSLIEGQFPNYQKVIPEKQEYLVVLNRMELINALTRVSIFAEQKSRKVILVFNKNQLLLASEETELGIANEEIACNYEGEKIIFALNYQYLIEPLKNIETNEISINFIDAKKPVTIYAVPKNTYFHLIMPMQI